MAKQLFNLPDRAVQQWKPFTFKGTTYDFSHLDARKHIFQHPTRSETYTLFFTISHHAFTRKREDGENIADIEMYPYRSDHRVFDPVRYELSRFLPQIIATIPDQFCHHGGYGRYCNFMFEDDDGNEVNYRVVYRVWKERGKMRFHIESAYPLQEPLGRVKKVDFWVICHNLLRGKKMPQPSS
ncbi:heat-shock protein [Vibrio cholerae]